MMDPVFLILGTLVLSVVLVAFVFLRSKSGDKPPGDNGGRAVGNVPHPGPVQRGPVVAAAGGRRRVQRNRMVARPQPEENEDEEDVYDDIAQPEGKVGAKKLLKLQQKAERKANREAELQEREEKKERDEQLAEIRKKEEEKQKAEEAEKEQEEKRIREEEEKRVHEEYLKLKESFVVEESGEEALSDDQAASLLQEFLMYIKEMKVVMLEDLAAKFKLRTQDAIDRVRQLQESGDLSGVLDDRGKFIYISQEEYEAVAKFIRQRGRVSISELAESSNKLINISPDNQQVHKKLMGEVSC